LLSRKKRWLPGAWLALAIMIFPIDRQAVVAAEVESLSIGNALAIAYENNPELAASQGEIGIAQGSRRQAGLIPNPTLSWEAEGIRRSKTTATLLLTQPIELGGKRGARIKLAERGQDVAAVGLERKRNLLAAAVIEAFYGALRAQARLDLAQQSYALAERGMRVATGRVESGKSSPLEATRAQIQLSAIQLELNEAGRLRTNAFRQLSVAMGGSRTELSHLQGDPQAFPERPEPSRLLALLPESADLRLAALQVEQGEAALALEKSHRIPNLSLSVGTQYEGQNRDRVSVLGVSMPLPLFDRNQGNVLAAARRTDQARDLRNATELRLRAETQQALDLWATALISVESYERQILPSAQKTVDTATRGFQMGKFGFLDVLDAQRTLIAARNQYLQALADVTGAWVQIVRLYGNATADGQD